MKNLIIGLCFLVITGNQLALAQPSEEAKKLQLAREGCQKPLGLFPSPSKLMCLLEAFGISEKEIKPKTLALVFTVCEGRTLQSQPAGTPPKKYNNLSACLSDPAAIALINKELISQGFPVVKIVNSAILSTAK